jgi:hypothetical protein
MTRSLERWLAALLVAVSVPARAEDPAAPAEAGAPAPAPRSEPEPEVLIRPGARHGGWGGPVVQLTTVRDRMVAIVGGRGGWLIDGRLTVGGGGFGLANRVPAPAAVEGPGEQLELEMGYGGGWVEYTFSPLRLVHLSVGTLVGGGGVNLAWRDGGSYGSDGDGFFVVEPAVTAEVNLARAVRADVGVAYRWITGVHMPGLSRADVSGPSAVLAFKFGKF